MPLFVYCTCIVYHGFKMLHYEKPAIMSYKLYLKSAITIWSFKMVQINVHDVLEDLTKLRSLIVKKEKLRKLSAFLIITICI